MAMSYPVIRVENFARIKEAVIELAPLTLFVGNNNTGKSYLSSLIWGFSQESFMHRWLWSNLAILKDEFQPIHFLQNWIENCLHDELPGNQISVSENDHHSLISVINDVLHRKKAGFAKAIFGRQIDIGHLSLGLPFNENRTLRMSVRQNPFSLDNTNQEHWGVEVKIDGNRSRGVMIRDLKDHTAIQWLVLCVYLSSYFQGASSFFPASRTGFLLTYKSLIDKSLAKNFGSRLKFENEKGDQLTMPQLSFLQSLAAQSGRNRKRRRESQKILPLIKFIEETIIGGSLSLNDLPVPELSYRPNDLEGGLPMFLSSGVVTEIAPLLSHLKYGSMDKRCVIEEPEMSLHPELQRSMAQILIRLTKLPVSVLVTTHSDTIIQHVNNMIKLANRRDGRELANEHGYTDDDIISAEQVRMYQFDTELKSHRTVVKKLEADVNGFAVPTFGDALRNLRNDVVAFYNDGSDVDESPKSEKTTTGKESS